jgi:hypothetical protein
VTQIHGSRADFMGNGFLLTPFLNNGTLGAVRDSAETTTWKKTSKTHMPGLGDATISIDGIWEGEEDLVDDILFAALGAPSGGVFTYFPATFDAIGNVTYTIDADETTYSINTAVGGVAQCSAALASGQSGYGLERGVVSSLYGAQGAAGSGPAIDNGAALGATLAGASLTLHSTISNALQVFLQDSADGVTFADLAGSIGPIANGRSSQRLEVPGTIRRYTRVRWTGTGTFMTVTSRR